MKFYEITKDYTFTQLWWSNEMRYNPRLCTKYPEKHPQAGGRAGTLKLKIKGKKTGDFLWTWYSECLITDRIAEIFEKNKITGYELWPVEIINRELPFKVWELKTLGWAGMAKPESGIKLEYRCEFCGYSHYSKINDPSNLIDEKIWDGSDIFMVWPLPAFKFVTQRVIDMIKKEKLKGLKIISVADLKTGDSGFSPGRLAYYMPEERARLLGEPLVIY